MVILLLVLETSQYPSGLCPAEVALLVSLDGDHPSSRHIFLRFDLPHVNEIKNLHCQPRICAQDASLQQFDCSIVVLPELMLLFMHKISSWPLLLLLFHRWPYGVPACRWFVCQLLLGRQLMCCWNRWSLHRKQRGQPVAASGDSGSALTAFWSRTARLTRVTPKPLWSSNKNNNRDERQ